MMQNLSKSKQLLNDSRKGIGDHNLANRLHILDYQSHLLVDDLKKCPDVEFRNSALSIFRDSLYDVVCNIDDFFDE